MNLINGVEIAQKVHEETRERLTALQARGLKPGLAVVLVGDDPPSRLYVSSKDKKASELGIYSRKLELPNHTPQAALLQHIQELNEDPAIHGILVQSPLPSHLNEAAIVHAIDPQKDVDGFHPENIAKLAMDDPSGFVPCTPLGCQRLLLEAETPVTGTHVVIVGRSLIVGKPLALLLMGRRPGGNATVTVAHSYSKNLVALTAEADIVISAIGQPCFITAKHIKNGATVLDVGINRIPDPSRPTGFRTVGDVDFEKVAPKCKAITPVPRGVGPMTIAMLMANTVTACERMYA